MQRRARTHESLDWVFSSIPMSLNSLDSKISPHSRHSTNSSSSWRATICTRGCLHFSMSFLSLRGACEGGMGVINPGCESQPRTAGKRVSPEISGILALPLYLSSGFRLAGPASLPSYAGASGTAPIRWRFQTSRCPTVCRHFSEGLG